MTPGTGIGWPSATNSSVLDVEMSGMLIVMVEPEAMVAPAAESVLSVKLAAAVPTPLELVSVRVK